MRRLSRLSLVLSVALAASLLSGCSSAKERTITGKVTLDGQPLSGGSVSFTGSDGTNSLGPIAADGTYKVTNPPKGMAKVTVRGGPSAKAPDPGMMDPTKMTEMGDPTKRGGGPATTLVEVPVKYSNPDNGLTVDINKDHQIFDIPLTR